MDRKAPGTENPSRVAPELTGLIRAGLWISALTVASKMLGLVREAVLAWAFGTSAIVDAFRVSQTGIFLLIHILAGSVLDSAFLPTFKHLLTGGRPRVAWLAAKLSGRALALAGLVLGGLLWIGAPVWTDLLAPGFDDQRRGLAVMLLRAMALAVPLGLMTNLFISIATGVYRFRIPALRALIQNVLILVGILLALWTGREVFLGLSLPVAQGVMVLLLVPVLLPYARRAGRGTRARDRIVWRHLQVALAPGLALVLLEQANVVVERIVASRLPEGSVASLDYARFLVETPMVTVGLGMTQVLLPALSDLSAGGDRARLHRSARALLIGGLWGVLPIVAWLFACGEDLVRILYQRGAFDEHSVQTTTSALFGFTVGLWAWFGGTVVLQKLLFADRRLRPLIPLTAGSLAVFAGLALTLAPHLGVRGVSLAFSASQLVYFAGALGIQGRDYARRVLPPLLYLLAGTAVVGLATAQLPEMSPPLRATSGLLCVALGWILWTLPSRELRSLGASLARRVLPRRRTRL